MRRHSAPLRQGVAANSPAEMSFSCRRTRLSASACLCSRVRAHPRRKAHDKHAGLTALCFAGACRNSTEYVRKWLVAKRARVEPEDVKEMATSDSLETRTYFVAVDHVSRSVVVSIRGTYSVSDTMVDLLCNPVGECGRTGRLMHC